MKRLRKMVLPALTAGLLATGCAKKDISNECNNNIFNFPEKEKICNQFENAQKNGRVDEVTKLILGDIDRLIKDSSDSIDESFQTMKKIDKKRNSIRGFSDYKEFDHIIDELSEKYEVEHRELSINLIKNGFYTKVKKALSVNPFAKIGGEISIDSYEKGNIDHPDEFHNNYARHLKKEYNL